MKKLGIFGELFHRSHYCHSFFIQCFDAVGWTGRASGL